MRALAQSRPLTATPSTRTSPSKRTKEPGRLGEMAGFKAEANRSADHEWILESDRDQSKCEPQPSKYKEGKHCMCDLNLAEVASGTSQRALEEKTLPPFPHSPQGAEKQGANGCPRARPPRAPARHWATALPGACAAAHGQPSPRPLPPAVRGWGRRCRPARPFSPPLSRTRFSSGFFFTFGHPGSCWAVVIVAGGVHRPQKLCHVTCPSLADALQGLRQGLGCSPGTEAAASGCAGRAEGRPGPEVKVGPGGRRAQEAAPPRTPLSASRELRNLREGAQAPTLPACVTPPVLQQTPGSRRRRARAGRRRHTGTRFPTTTEADRGAAGGPEPRPRSEVLPEALPASPDSPPAPPPQPARQGPPKAEHRSGLRFVPPALRGLDAGLRAVRALPACAGPARHLPFCASAPGRTGSGRPDRKSPPSPEAPAACGSEVARGTSERDPQVGGRLSCPRRQRRRGVGGLKQAPPCGAWRSGSTAKKEDIKLSVRKFLNRRNIVSGDYTWTEFDDPFLSRHGQSVSIADPELKPIDLGACTIALHIFQLNEGGPSSETLEEETDNITAASHGSCLQLNSMGFGMDSLVYEVEVQSHLLDDVMTPYCFQTRTHRQQSHCLEQGGAVSWYFFSSLGSALASLLYLITIMLFVFIQFFINLAWLHMHPHYKSAGPLLSGGAFSLVTRSVSLSLQLFSVSKKLSTHEYLAQGHYQRTPKFQAGPEPLFIKVKMPHNPTMEAPECGAGAIGETSVIPCTSIRVTEVCPATEDPESGAGSPPESHDA
ncbi:dapper homolog 3-like [Hyaena hyaena]|uniref:dapper homolog 3-like n=1 Tax=Hyaena hyaena TaxID=95912 RepID=UPI0019223DEB|nr:dapper homolog 3-like [Hyaena hyaena]